MKTVSFDAYVLSVAGDHKLCVRVVSEDIPVISSVYWAYQQMDDKRDVVYINVKRAKFNISIPWDDLDSLVGMHIRVSSDIVRYAFWKTNEVLDDNGGFINMKIRCKGFTFMVKQIKNITDA